MPIWNDFYKVFKIKKCRLIIRNQWHEFTSLNDFDLFKIGKRRFNQRTQFHFSILGFQFVLFVN